MTEDQAFGLIGALVGATNGWTEDAVDIYTAEVQTWDDLDSAQIAIADLCRTWSEPFKPSLGQVVERYRAERARNVRAEQEALEPPAEVYPSHERGWEIARQAYQVAYGREMGTTPEPDPERAAQVIRDHKRLYNDFYVANYVEVLQRMHGDQQLTRTSLLALGTRLTWDNRGGLALKANPVTAVPSGTPGKWGTRGTTQPAELPANQARQAPGPLPEQSDIQEPSQMEAARAIDRAARDLAQKLSEEF